MYTVSVSLCQTPIATRLVAAPDALTACDAVERLMRRPSLAEAAVIERTRAEYKLAEVWLEYQARREPQNASIN